jgi:hypothetical protein
MLGIGRLLAILVFLADGGPRVNLAAFDGACGVLTPMALGWEAHVSWFSFLFWVVWCFGLMGHVGF